MQATFQERIAALKAERDAIILAHNYTMGEVQDVADYVGDSLGLARTAAETGAKVIVFAGVHFMAETVAILCPGKTVLLPDENAGCPMANMCMARQLADYRAAHPDTVVVTYVNSSAAVKALSDICCTSANAVEVVKTIPEDKPILFVPDRNLGHYVMTTLGREMELWPGYCPTHERMLPKLVAQARAEHPEAVLVAHPECRPPLLAEADHIASTTGILTYCRESEHKNFLVATELGILHRLRKENPEKEFHPASAIAECENMKLMTLEKILWSLQDLRPRITVEPEVAAKARAPIEKMLAVLP